MEEINTKVKNIYDRLQKEEKNGLNLNQNKNRQEIQYYFTKVLQDDAKIRLICSKYQQAILKGSKTIQELEDSNISEIGKEPENFGGFDDDGMD